jgi:probable rRNA maturation factor
VNIYYENETEEKPDFDAEKLAGLVAGEVLESEKCPFQAAVNLLITDSEGIRTANSQFRKIDRETDVLSFPGVQFDKPSDFAMLNGSEPDCFDPDDDTLMLGDIMINIDRVHSQAREYGHSEKREFAFLVAHSMFHLCGYDHMTPEEAAVMEQKQKQILQKLGITRENG